VNTHDWKPICAIEESTAVIVRPWGRLEEIYQHEYEDKAAAGTTVNSSTTEEAQ
jgi:hypothetical protein